MKPDDMLTSRYDDLLTDPADDALNQLVQELDSAYTAPARPDGLSWMSASQQLLLSQQTLVPQRSLEHLHSKHGRRTALFAFAAVAAVVLISATVLTTLGAPWLRSSSQAQTSPSPVLMADVQLLQQLWKNDGTPANVRQLDQSGQFTKLNLHLATDNVTIQSAYADGNNLIIGYTIDQNAWNNARTCPSLHIINPWQPNSCPSVPALTVTTSDHQTLTENVERANMGPQPVFKNQHVALLAYYDTSSIQGNPAQLQLSVSLAKKISPSQERVGTFTVPFHADKKVINVNQTATSNGDAITLERVVITPTETRFYNKNMSSLRGNGLYFDGFSIAGKEYKDEPFPDDNNTYGWFGYGLPAGTFTFQDPLQSQKGTWVVKESAVIVTFPMDVTKDYPRDSWTFTFTVS